MYENPDTFKRKLNDVISNIKFENECSVIYNKDLDYRYF